MLVIVQSKTRRYVFEYKKFYVMFPLKSSCVSLHHFPYMYFQEKNNNFKIIR